MSYLSLKPRVKILFPPGSERENNIRKGFRFARHHVEFSELTPENIRRNDLVVPLTMWELRDMIAVGDLLKDNAIPLPSLESVDICDDKFLFSKTLEEKGFGDVIPRIGKGLPFPYMVKKKVAQSGDNCYIIADVEQEQKYKDEINDPEYFCQQLIQGRNEFATHILFIDHKIVSAINIEYIFANGAFVKGKDKFICTKISPCPHLDVFAEIMDAIGFEGLCCFNYKEVEGKPSVFEINPRFGGSLSTFFFSFIRRLDIKRAHSPAINPA